MIEQLAPARSHSRRHHLHASCCALPCRTTSTGHVRTLQSAPRPLTKQCSLFGPSGKMFRVNYWASASTQNLATPSFDINSPQLNLLRGDSMSLKGHRLLVKMCSGVIQHIESVKGPIRDKGKPQVRSIKSRGTGRYGGSQKKGVVQRSLNKLTAEAGFESSRAAALVPPTPAWAPGELTPTFLRIRH